MTQTFRPSDPGPQGSELGDHGVGSVLPVDEAPGEDADASCAVTFQPFLVH